MANEDTFHLGIKAVIRNKTGKVLVLKSNPKYKDSTSKKSIYWDLPGGRLQKGQNIKETLKRDSSKDQKEALQILSNSYEKLGQKDKVLETSLKLLEKDPQNRSLKQKIKSLKSKLSKR